MTVRRHRRYSTEFKIQLVQAYLDGEGSARSIATRHEVPHSLLMVWIKKYEAGDLTREIHLQEEVVEYGAKIAALERKIGQLTMELDIMKKRALIRPSQQGALLLKAWLRPLVVGLSLWLGICGGSWATLHWLSTRIEARIETAAALDLDIGEATPDPGAARDGHLGDRASGDRGGAVRGAAGRRARLSALDRGHSAGREAVERVKELYDRVRTAVDEGLADVVRAVRAGAAAARRAGRDLAAAGRSLGAAGRAAKRASDILGPGLQDARRDVTRARALMRQRGRERDHGPSR